MERTRAELTVLNNTVSDLRTIVMECAELIGVLPKLAELNNHCTSVEELEKYIDEEIFHINYLDTSNEEESKNGYSTRYDMRTSGSLIYTYNNTYEWNGKEETERKEVYRDTLLDKFHTLVSLMYYNLHNLRADYEPRQDIVVPASACDPWTQARMS